MKKISLILALLVSLTIRAQISNDTVSLRELEIVSAANPQKFSDISRSVQIINKDQIQSSASQSIDDLLKYYGGADIRSRGAMGVQSDISLRGGGFDQGLIMINGISLNDPQTGHHNLNQAIDFDDIEQIEIFDGPGTRWFGANSFSGGINLITNSKKENDLRISLQGGQHSYYNARISYNYKIGKTYNKTSASAKVSDGYARNTDFKTYNFNHSTIIETTLGDLNINLGAMDKGFGANSFYTPKYPDQYEHIRTYFATAGIKGGDKIKYNANVFWRRNHDRFELFREDADWYVKQGEFYIMGSDTAGFPTPGGLYPYKGHNYHRSDVYGANAGVNISSVAGETSVKFEFKNESIVSNVLGEAMDDTIFIKNSDGFYTKSKSRNNLNFAVNQLYRHNNFSLSAGLSVFYNEDFGTHLSPGIDLGYFISENFKIFASANKAIRLPTYTDLYYQGPTNIANPDLKPESSISTEAGIKFLTDRFTSSLSGFYRLGDNIIDWIKYNPDEKWQSANIIELNTYGISLSADYKPQSNIVNFAGLKYTWINSEKQNTDIISLYALDYLKHNFIFYLNHNIVKGLSASWSLNVQNRNGSFIEYESGLEQDYSTNTLLNLKLIYTYKNFEFNVNASNLLNKEYYDIGNVRQPGIWVIGGISYHLGK